VADLCEINQKGQDRGTYILLARLKKNHRIKPGSLPETDYEEGVYLYVGRARTGLSARIKRHVRREKKLFWHIDYLLQEAKIEGVWVRREYFAECDTARDIGKSCPSTVMVIRRFGSSDCRCPGHLLHFPPPGKTDLGFLTDILGFEKVTLYGNDI
jgi:sugar fermentation stimulation protein A